MFTITIKTNNKIIKKEYSNKVLLSDALSDAGIHQLKPCGGNGKCGKCKVIANGKEVLSCITYADTDTTVEYTPDGDNIQGLTDGISAAFDKKPLVKEGFGLAVDIGTTTIAGYLFEFPQCRLVYTKGVLNTQAEFGADVISRIEYSDKGGLEELKKKVTEQIDSIAPDTKIEKYVITGNTTMLHLFTGLDPSGIARAPFTPKSLFGNWYGNVFLPPCISSYVGADITTAILASDMMENKVSFLVDIGTNGEMVLCKDEKLYCCSTAAGPAFEGAGIKNGMLAARGAINKVYIENGTLKYTTIDNAPAAGICGTGLIDAVSCMLELGIIDETGFMESDFEISDSNIFITAEDIRKVQLAKSAIRSGIDTLLHESGTALNEIEAFYIAGGFGSFINKTSAAKIGLIPFEVLENVKSIGNAAGNGAAMILQSKDCLEKSQAIANCAQVIELSSSSFFMDKYVENMMFY